MKKIKFIILALLISLFVSGCSDKPPKYNGEKPKIYAEKIGKYYKKKIKNAGAKNIRTYISKSHTLINSLRQQIRGQNVQNSVKLVDKTIEQLIKLSNKYLNLSYEDYKFFANPLKYYGIYDDYDNSTQFFISSFGGITYNLIFDNLRMNYKSKIYSPFYIELENSLKNNDDKYYYILKHTKYKLFLNDDKWIKNYKTKKDILDTVIKIAKENKLYFKIDIEKFKKDKQKLKNMENNPSELFDLIFLQRGIKNIYNYKNIYDLIDAFNKTNVDDYKIKTSKNLKIAQKGLDEAINNKLEQVKINYWKEQVQYYLNKIKEYNNESEKKYKYTQNNIKKILSKVNYLKNNDNSKKAQHDLTIFIKTLQILLQKGYSSFTISKYITGDTRSGRYIPIISKNINNINKDYTLDSFLYTSFKNYLKNMKELLTQSNISAKDKSKNNVNKMSENINLKKLQNYIKQNDKNSIANMINYPLNVPPIKDKQELIKNYDKIFDANLKNIILNSTEQDLTVMGDKGTMLKDGLVWFRNNKIIAINYQSEK